LTTKARKRTTDLNLSTLNVRSVKEDVLLDVLIRELRFYHVNIVAIQETRRRNENMSREGFSVFMSNVARSTNHGVGFLVDAKWTKAVIDWRAISERICVLRVKGRFFNNSLINVYAPHNHHDDEVKETFYEQLSGIYISCPRHDVKVILGDFNAIVGRGSFYKVFTKEVNQQ
jgi:exonuclease III